MPGVREGRCSEAGCATACLALLVALLLACDGLRLSHERQSGAAAAECALYLRAHIHQQHAFFRVEQVLTAAVVQELRSRTNFQVVLSNEGAGRRYVNGVITNV